MELELGGCRLRPNVGCRAVHSSAGGGFMCIVEAAILILSVEVEIYVAPAPPVNLPPLLSAGARS